jgi:hypothetical protein
LRKHYRRIDLDLIELLIKNQSSQSKNLLVGMSGCVELRVTRIKVPRTSIW